MSTHGPQWFANCYTFESFQTLVYNWRVNVIRIAMYVNEGGYNTNPSYWKGRVTELVEWAEILGIYAIVDWHTLTPGNPWDSSYDQRWDFWGYISDAHKNRKNVLYEIANEPNNVDWGTIASHHVAVIDMIRKIDPNTVIICGTPRWSQDFDSIYPLNYGNIMYTLHFYASSHYVSDSLRNAACKYPIFVTEYGLCEASGGGRLDFNNGETWMRYLNGENNCRQIISYVNWSFSDAPEACAALNGGSCGGRNFNNPTESGRWV